jgi:hypothetical protein
LGGRRDHRSRSGLASCRFNIDILAAQRRSCLDVFFFSIRRIVIVRVPIPFVARRRRQHGRGQDIPAGSNGRRKPPQHVIVVTVPIQTVGIIGP